MLSYGSEEILSAGSIVWLGVSVRTEAWTLVSGVKVRYSVLEPLEDDEPNSKTHLEPVKMQQI